MNDSISFSSIEEIHVALSNHQYSPRDLYEYLKVNRESSTRIIGSENSFHNLSVEFSRQNCEPFAAAVAFYGTESYPMSTTLIADYIKYSQEIGHADQCKKGIEKLRGIDGKYWTWRTFVFAIDFLKDSLSLSSSISEYEENLSTAKELISDFKQFIPHEERPYVAEAELYQNQNNYDHAIGALLEGIKSVNVAPQCCMKLADLYLELGEYAKVEYYARQGLLSTMQDQPTISIGYLYYLLAMAMDAQRLQLRRDGKAVDKDMIQSIITAYHTADQLFINESRSSVAYRKTIKAKLIIIAMEEGISEEQALLSALSKDNLHADSYELLKLLQSHKDEDVG